MKKILSYIFPFISKVKTEFSGDVLVSWVNGKKTLDTENANYSYGSLQRILETGIGKIDLQNVHSLLLLGLGGGSIIQSLRKKFNYHGKIHAIEFDAKMIAIARNEFHITTNENLMIENTEAFEFVKHTQNIFDLLIVDLFIDNAVPAPFYSEEFCNNMLKILNKNGSVIFNLGIEDMNMTERNRVIKFFKSNSDFRVTVLEKVEGSNTLLVASCS